MGQRCAIGLGSNLSDPQQQLSSAFVALAQLPNTTLITSSALYQSRAVGPEQPDYLNACALLDTELAPHDLLDALQRIENQHQRVRGVHWGPRTLDLDLLLYGQQQVSSERLNIPHPYLHLRNFVIYPLMDIWPDAQLPDGRTLASLKKHSTMEGLMRLPPAQEPNVD